jgi:hypothetical protein
MPVRLRQVALVARSLTPVADALRGAFDLGEPFRDPAVAAFGLENVVFALGDTFLEVVAPVNNDTAAGRYLDRRGGDSGYMAIFAVPDMGAARRRVAELGIRTVWQVDRPEMSGTHLHPKDLPGAIVSLDTPRPDGSWAWGGPAWSGNVPPHRAGGVVGLAIDCTTPAHAAHHWALALGLEAIDQTIALDGGRQWLLFRSAGERGEGIAEVTIKATGADRAVRVGGVTFSVEG